MTTPNYPSEDEIADTFFKYLNKEWKDSFVVQNWLGWSYNEDGGRRGQKRFVREFDLACFIKDEMGNLFLFGFEVKGWGKTSRGTMIEPSFAAGLNQALVLLQLGADFSYLVYPDLANREDKDALRELCERFAPNIGTYFVENNLSSVNIFRAPNSYNPYSTAKWKAIMLSYLIASGHYTRTGPLPDWARNVDY